jgi:hypothetical protein
MDEQQAVRTGMRKLVALAYAPPVPRPKSYRRVGALPGPVFDAAVLGLFMVLGLGLLGASLLPT